MLVIVQIHKGFVGIEPVAKFSRNHFIRSKEHRLCAVEGKRSMNSVTKDSVTRHPKGFFDKEHFSSYAQGIERCKHSTEEAVIGVDGSMIIAKNM